MPEKDFGWGTYEVSMHLKPTGGITSFQCTMKVTAEDLTVAAERAVSKVLKCLPEEPRDNVVVDKVVQVPNRS